MLKSPGEAFSSMMNAMICAIFAWIVVMSFASATVLVPTYMELSKSEGMPEDIAESVSRNSNRGNDSSRSSLGTNESDLEG